MMLRKRFTSPWVWLLLAALLLSPPPACPEKRNPVQKLDLAGFKKMVDGEGRFLLVFMAAWCAPCVKELPDLTALYAKYRSSGLQILGVSVDFDGPAAIQPIVDRQKVDFPVFWLGEEALDAYGISGIPLLIFIVNGAEVDRVVGLHSKAFLAEKIVKFLSLP
ncbi:MAG: TlpA disulfide reductase family protein [Desulfobacterales bacterium]